MLLTGEVEKKYCREVLGVIASNIENTILYVYHICEGYYVQKGFSAVRHLT